ncbi:MAG TPA: hypothetical protein ENG87_03490 [Candidatus Pacearchaeota archaeon]|nr:hypothetical protein [Candidatus Pacearchaeota archaeon]
MRKLQIPKILIILIMVLIGIFYSAGIEVSGACASYEPSILANKKLIGSPSETNENTVSESQCKETYTILNQNELSEEQINCKKAKRCWDGFGCRPLGYRSGEMYCTKVKVYSGLIYEVGFANQSKIGASCNNNYECETNICLEEVCISRTDEINLQVDAKFEELKQEIVDKAEEELNKLNENETYSLEVEDEKVSVDKNIIEKILNWIKNIFS